MRHDNKENISLGGHVVIGCATVIVVGFVLLLGLLDLMQWLLGKGKGGRVDQFFNSIIWDSEVYIPPGMREIDW